MSLFRSCLYLFDLWNLNTGEEWDISIPMYELIPFSPQAKTFLLEEQKCQFVSMVVGVSYGSIWIHQTFTLNVSESFLICNLIFQRNFWLVGGVAWWLFQRLDLPEAWCSKDSFWDGAGPFSILYFRSSWLDLGRGGLVFQSLRLRRGWTFRHLPHPSYGLHFEAALKIQFSGNYFYIKVHHVDGETSLEYLSFPIFNSFT